MTCIVREGNVGVSECGEYLLLFEDKTPKCATSLKTGDTSHPVPHDIKLGAICPECSSVIYYDGNNFMAAINIKSCKKHGSYDSAAYVQASSSLIASGSLELIKYVYDKIGFTVNEVPKNRGTFIGAAALYGRLDVVEWLIKEKGWDPMLKNISERTVMDSAIRGCKQKVIDYLKQFENVK